ncbi:MAG: prolyl aminopeptidase [Pseudomonadota bacterium]
MDLYPPREAYASGMLDVGDGHRLAWEESGDPQGAPALFLHGGPGAGFAPAHRRFFDPAFFRLIAFDQRGCGRSTPHAETHANTTDDLIADIERLRTACGVERWAVFGGSWGATLGLRYAQTYPERVAALILRGVFLGRRREIDWFLHGVGRFFPEAARAFLGHLPEGERGDPLAAYHRRLNDPDPAIHAPAAAAWSYYEAYCSSLTPPNEQQAAGDPQAALAIARLEAHYFVNRLFMTEDVVLKNAARLKDMPGTIVQGRYDMICPLESADALARAWPKARFIIAPQAGHAAMEPGLRRGLVGAVEALKPRWSGRWDA